MYTYNDDDDDPMQMGGNQSYGQNQLEQVFDGRRLRPPLTRRYMDIFQAFTLYKQHLPYKNFVQFPQNIPNQFRFLEPTFVYNEEIGVNINTKFIRFSRNKDKSGIQALAWQPDGKRLIAGHKNGQITLFDGVSFNFKIRLPRHEINSTIFDIIWSHNGDYMLSVDMDNWLKMSRSAYDVVHQWKIHSENVRQLTFAPSDRKFASCSDDTTVKIWDLSTRREERSIDHGTNVYTVDWHPSRSLLASGAKDGVISLIDPRIDKALSKLTFHKSKVTKLQWNHNGYWIISGGCDAKIRLIDIRTMSEMMVFQGHEKDVLALTWHPTEEQLFVSGGYTGELHWWCVGEPRPVYSMPTAHTQAITQLQYHPCGHVLASSSKEGIINFWARNHCGDDLTHSSNETVSNIHSVVQTNSKSLDIPGLAAHKDIFGDDSVEEQQEQSPSTLNADNGDQEIEEGNEANPIQEAVDA